MTESYLKNNFYKLKRINSTMVFAFLAIAISLLLFILFLKFWLSVFLWSIIVISLLTLMYICIEICQEVIHRKKVAIGEETQVGTTKLKKTLLVGVSAIIILIGSWFLLPVVQGGSSVSKYDRYCGIYQLEGTSQNILYRTLRTMNYLPRWATTLPLGTAPDELDMTIELRHNREAILKFMMALNDDVWESKGKWHIYGNELVIIYDRDQDLWLRADRLDCVIKNELIRISGGALFVKSE